MSNISVGSRIAQLDQTFDKNINITSKHGSFDSIEAAQAKAEQVASSSNEDAVILKGDDGSFQVFGVDELRKLNPEGNDKKGSYAIHDLEPVSGSVINFVVSKDTNPKQTINVTPTSSNGREKILDKVVTELNKAGISPELVEKLTNGEGINKEEAKVIYDSAIKSGNNKVAQMFDMVMKKDGFDNGKIMKLPEIIYSAISANVGSKFTSAVKDYEKLIADGSLSPSDIKTLESGIEKIKEPSLKSWMKNALDLVKKNSPPDASGNLVPKNDVVKNLINPKSLEAIEDRRLEAKTHPILGKIADPDARKQMSEFLQQYMTDPVFMAVGDSRYFERSGTETNFMQGAGALFDYHGLGSNSIDSGFGACIECQDRVKSIFEQFKSDWSSRPENSGKEFKLSSGDVQTKTIGMESTGVGFEHNFVFIKTNDKETFYVDPWGSQKTDSESVVPKKSALDEKAGAFAGSFTYVYEDKQEVYSPADADVAL